MATAKATTNHNEIRKWVEARKGHPARVKATGRGKDPGILRIDFPGFSGEDTLEEIGWDEFFEWFDKNNLALLLSSARGNRFNKLVERTSAKSGGRRAAGGGRGAKKASSSTKKASTAKKKASTSKKASSAKKASSTKKSATSAKKASSKAAASRRTPKTAAKKAATSKKASPAKRSLLATSKKRSTSKKTSASSKSTTNHDVIRKWVEARGGFPATVSGTENRGEEAGLLRIDYPGYSGKDTLERIDWDAWFEKFDAEKLAFLYQDKRNSRFSKLVRR